MAPIRPLWIVLVLALVYTIFLSTLSIASHRGLRTQMNDLGNADQALWAAANGDLAMTQSNDVDGQLRSRIGVHANFIFWPLSCFYLIWPHPELLLVLTSIACAVAGVGLFVLARSRLGDEWWALAPPIAFWLSPMVHDANLYDFHVITIVAALLVWAIWAFDTGHTQTAWTLLILALLCQEDVPLITFMLGLYLLLTGSRRAGRLVMGMSLAYFIILMAIIVPAFNQGQGLAKLSGMDNRYDWLGAGLMEMIWAVLQKPGEVLAHILRPDRLRLPVYLLLCGAIVALRQWRMLLLLIPPMATAMLSRTTWNTRVTGSYYWVVCEAVIIIACILAAERAMNDGAKRRPWPLVYLGGMTLFLSLLLSPLPHGLCSSWENFALPPERHTLAEMIRLIPADAPVAVQNNLGPHLSQRREVAVFGRRLKTANYALFHLRYTSGPDAGLFARTDPLILFQLPPRELARVVAHMANLADWGLIAQKDGFYVFQRNAGSSLSREETVRRINADAVQMQTSIREASRHRLSWAKYLNGDVSWSDF